MLCCLISVLCLLKNNVINNVFVPPPHNLVSAFELGWAELFSLWSVKKSAELNVKNESDTAITWWIKPWILQCCIVYFMGQCYVQQWDVTKNISFTQVLYIKGLCVTMCSYLRVSFLLPIQACGQFGWVVAWLLCERLSVTVQRLRLCRFLICGQR